MTQNALKRRWKEGKAAVNGWLAIPSAFSAEVMAQCGWDSITVDLQHGVQDYLSMVACFQAMHAHPVPGWLACHGTSRASSARCSTVAPMASSAR